MSSIQFPMSPIQLDEETKILYRFWESPAARGVFLLVHGLGGHSGRWQSLGEYFQKKDISSFALELKGFGETLGLRGHCESLDIYFQDIQRLYAIIKEKNIHQNIFLVGESLGALISFLAVINQPQLFRGLICLSPAFKSRMQFTFPEYAKIFLSFLGDSRRQFTVPFDSKMCTRDIPSQKKMDSDDREHRLATAELLVDIVLAQLHSRLFARRVKTGVLFLLAGQDQIVDPAASVKIFNSLQIEDKKIIRYPEMYHALSIDVGREQVFEDMLKWARERM
ncbi:MAG: alpha/beta fold hydrolase [Candidatus Omnitrophota bacterium]